MITILVQIEGVLAETKHDNFVENGPIKEGLLLCHALRSTAQMSFYTENGEERARYWLQREGIREGLKVYPNVTGVEDLITKARFDGHDMQLIVTADPEHARQAFNAGLQSLLFIHPAYGRPEWQPGHEDEIRPWDQMVEEVVEKRLQLAADDRKAEHE